MGAEPLSFSAIRRTQLAQFISYREAITKLAAVHSDSLADVAIAIKMHEIHRNGTAFLSGPERDIRRFDEGEKLECLLKKTMLSSIIEPIKWLREYIDPNLVGWMRDELITALNEKSLLCPSSLKTPSESSEYTVSNVQQQPHD